MPSSKARIGVSQYAQDIPRICSTSTHRGLCQPGFKLPYSRSAGVPSEEALTNLRFSACSMECCVHESHDSYRKEHFGLSRESLRNDDTCSSIANRIPLNVLMQVLCWPRYIMVLCRHTQGNGEECRLAVLENQDYMPGKEYSTGSFIIMTSKAAPWLLLACSFAHFSSKQFTSAFIAVKAAQVATSLLRCC